VLGLFAALVVSQAQAVSYDFSSGYTNGLLAGQNGWTGGENYVVDGAVQLNPTEQWEAAVAPGTLDTTASDNTFTVQANFTFEETAASGNNDVISLTFNDIAGATTTMRGYMVRSGSDSYALGIKDPTGTTVVTSPDFDDDILGLGSDTNSSELIISMTVEKGSSTNDWKVSIQLMNVTDSLSAGPFSATDVSVDSGMESAAALYGGFSSSRSDDTSKTANRLVHSFALTSSYTAPVSTIVQWGELTGDINIVGATAPLDILTLSRTYTAGVDVTDPLTAAYPDYYTNSTGRSPSFNMAYYAGLNLNSYQIKDDVAGDQIDYGRNTADIRYMVTWEATNFLASVEELSSLTVSIKGSGAGFTNGVYRFLIQQSGQFYVSEASPMTTSFAIGSADVALQTWYAFTPFDNAKTIDVDMGIIASTATTITTFDNIDAVGYYVDLDGNGTFLGSQVSYFQAVAEVAEAEPVAGFAGFVTLYGLTGVPTDDKDGDGLNDYGEYVFGGNPDDGGTGDVGTLPSFDTATGDYSFSLIGDNTVVAHVVTTDDLVDGTWGTNETISVTATDGILSGYTSAVGTAGPQLFIKLLVD
jgi:hypothetical protein